MIRQPNYDYLKEVLDYDPETGIFIWKKNVSIKSMVGKIAGYTSVSGRVKISIKNNLYFAHRLAWFYYYGYMPENGIDHINRDASDNRITNLREASKACNMHNSKIAKNNISGIKGIDIVKYKTKKGTTTIKYQARIVIAKKYYYLGYFNTMYEAAKARYEAEIKFNFIACDFKSSALEYIQQNKPKLQRRKKCKNLGLL